MDRGLFWAVYHRSGFDQPDAAARANQVGPGSGSGGLDGGNLVGNFLTAQRKQIRVKSHVLFYKILAYKSFLRIFFSGSKKKKLVENLKTSLLFKIVFRTTVAIMQIFPAFSFQPAPRGKRGKLLPVRDSCDPPPVPNSPTEAQPSLPEKAVYIFEIPGRGFTVFSDPLPRIN